MHGGAPSIMKMVLWQQGEHGTGRGLCAGRHCEEGEGGGGLVFCSATVKIKSLMN